ncbi:MAG: Esterase, partial [Frankiales bacterium]|nr:Esterase [Frankiales bacterium]
MPSTPPDVDAELAPRLAALSKVMSPSLQPEGIAPMRRVAAAVRPSLDELSRGGAIEVTEREVPGPAGAGTVPLLVLRPRDLPGRLPCLLYLHGGGMVTGDNRSGIEDVLDHVLALGVAVVSVDYRLAPEHPHPAPASDCYAALEGVVARAPDFGVDPRRVVLVGRSAGGALAAGLAQAVRDGGGPSV